MDLPRFPDRIDSVGDLWHESFGEAQPPVAVLVIGGESYGVATRIGGVVPGAIVVGGPVEKLQVGVRADRIDVKEVGHAEFAETNFEAPPRQFIEEGEEAALVLNLFFAESKHLVNHRAAHIRGLAQRRITDDIEICVSGEAEAGAESGTSGFFNVDQNFSGVV